MLKKKDLTVHALGFTICFFFCIEEKKKRKKDITLIHQFFLVIIRIR